MLCNTPFSQYIPFQFPAFSGTYNDFVVLSLATLLLMPSPVLVPFHESMANIIANLASFMTSTSGPVAEKLVKIFQHWSSHDLLRMGTTSGAPGTTRNPFTLALITEAIATLLQYQFPGCFPLALELSKHEAQVVQLAEEYRTLQLPLPESLRGQLLIPTLQCAATTMKRALDAEQQRDGGGGGLITMGAIPPAQSDLFRKRMTLVGSLPVPHHITSRRVESGYAIDAWLTKVFWGAVFLHSIADTLVDHRSVRLFATVSA
jgi:hypothetical protein